MGKLYLLLLFYWVLLIENGTDWLGVFLDLGNGLEIRLTLLFKALFLFINLYIILIVSKKIIILRHVYYFMVFLLLSTCYTLIIHPSYFIGALSVNLHIQLLLNIILFIYLCTNTENQIKKFYEALRIFGLFNGVLVILSYFFPQLSTFFEAGIANSGVRRAFGIMGDEVSMVLTFFFYDSLVFKRYFIAAFYIGTILCTGGIGAFITLVALILYYLFFVIKISRKQYPIVALLFFALLIIGILAISQLQELSAIRRLVNNFDNPEEETGKLRILSLTTAYEMIIQRPFLGYGYGAYAPAVYDRYEPIYRALGQGWNFKSMIVILGSSFNPFVQMLCETGIFGLLLFINLLRRFRNTCKLHEFQNSKFLTSIRVVSFGWLTVFFVTCISANWFLPASYLLLIVVTLVGINLKLNSLERPTFSK